MDYMCECKCGKRGKRGHQGSQGVPGPMGPQGPQGPPGLVPNMFLASLTSTLEDVTGNGQFVTLTGFTATVNDGSAFNPATGVYTAAASNPHYFAGNINLTGLDLPHLNRSVSIYLNGSFHSYVGTKLYASKLVDETLYFEETETINFYYTMYLNAGDEVSFVVRVAGADGATVSVNLLQGSSVSGGSLK